MFLICEYQQNDYMKIKYLPILLVLLTFCASPKKETINKIDNKAGSPYEDKIEALIAKMSLQEKIGQTAQRGTSSRGKGLSEELKQAVREGRVGSFLNLKGKANVAELQRLAVEESPNGIPLIFARDVIHGYKTIFPIPLGQAATWNPKIVERGSRVAAIEATSMGIRWTFAPMLDISRDPRWGRIAESAGEDPFLTSEMAKAYVKGFQGDNLNSQTSLAACGKHFVGYGAAEGGRDYNTAIIHDQLLHNVYLKPFKAAKEAGIATYMTSFNELNGIPASGNKYILQDVLRDTWNFDGFVVSDWNSITEMIAHGYSENPKAAAKSAANAGLDMEMTSQAYDNHLEELIKEGAVSMDQLDDMVRNILRIKFKMGLFDTPYFDKNQDVLYKEDHLVSAKEAAVQSMVLLKNRDDVLPINEGRKIALIGPLADAPHEQLGTWTFDGEKEHTVTPLSTLTKQYGKKVTYVKGLANSRDNSSKDFKKAIKAAKKSDLIVFVGGEEAILSGEAHSRANINLPGAQEELLTELAKTGKPIVLVIMAGRPITLGNILDKVDAVLFAWHPGTMGGPALVELLYGKASPSGRLPVSWPKTVGQIPVHYNHKSTGRPASKESFVHIDDIPEFAWQSSLGNTSHYLDAGFSPQYPFGYGLTYSKFNCEGLTQSSSSLSNGGKIVVTATLNNIGDRKATEVVQLYVQDEFASITRPVKELKGFKRITLEAGKCEKVTFEINKEDLSFYNADGEWVTEAGSFKFWIGPNAMEGLSGSFEVE